MEKEYATLFKIDEWMQKAQRRRMEEKNADDDAAEDGWVADVERGEIGDGVDWAESKSEANRRRWITEGRSTM